MVTLNGHVCECDSVQFVTVSCVTSRGRGGLSGNKDVLTQLCPLSKVSPPISLSFTSPPSHRCVPPCPCLARSPRCFARVLLTYSSPLGFEKFSLFRHSWVHFNRQQTNGKQSSGILSSSRSSGDSGDAWCHRGPIEGRIEREGTNVHTSSFISLDMNSDRSGG